MNTATMDAEDKEWQRLGEQLLHHSSVPDHLNAYSPDAHGTIFDTGSAQQRWLAEFGVSGGSPVHTGNGFTNAGLQQSQNKTATGAGEVAEELQGRALNTGQVSGTAATQQGQQQLSSWSPTDRAQHGVALHQQQLQQLAASLPSMQHQQQQVEAANMQQQQQQVQQMQQLPQLQAYQLFLQQQQQAAQQQAQQQQQRPVLNASQQQLWGLQQQLWGLQQQAALIAHQQHQLQQGQQQYTALSQMGVPMPLNIQLNANGIAAAANQASFSPDAAQQQSSIPGLPNMAFHPASMAAGNGIAGAMPLSVAAAAAAAVAAAPTKRPRAPAKHSSRSSLTSTTSAPSPAAVAAAVAAPHVAPHHLLMTLGKPAPVVKKQRERHRSVVSSLEAELADKLAQLQMLSAENEMLKLRAAVLEATVQSREDQMHVISQHGPPVYPIDAPNPAPRSVPSTTATASSSISGDTGSPTAAVTASSVPHSNSTGKLPSAELQSSASTAAEQLAGAVAVVKAEAAASEGDAAVAAADPLQQQQQQQERKEQQHVADLQDFQKDVNGTRETIKHMCVDDIVRHWKQFLQDVTGELVNVQKEESTAAFKQQTGKAPNAAALAAASLPNEAVAALLQQGQHHVFQHLSPSHQRINELVAKYSFLVKTAQQLNPGAYCRLFGMNLDTGLPAPYSDAHWRRVVKVLDLTKQQVNHILACAELYFSCRARLQSEQRVLQQHLKETFAATEGMLLASMTDDSPMRPWLDKLANNLKREHVLRVMLNSFVFGKIFTPVQCAKASVYSHPWYIDVHAIVCVMCEDALTMPAANGQRPLVFAHRLVPGPQQGMVM